MAIDPSALNPHDVGAKVDAFIDKVSSAPRREGVEEILYPGQRSQQIRREAWARGTVEIPTPHIKALVDLGDELGIAVPPSLRA